MNRMFCKLVFFSALMIFAAIPSHANNSQEFGSRAQPTVGICAADLVPDQSSPAPGTVRVAASVQCQQNCYKLENSCMLNCPFNNAIKCATMCTKKKNACMKRCN